MIIDYVFSTIDINILAFIIGVFWGVLFELMIVLIVEIIGGKYESRHKTNKKED